MINLAKTHGPRQNDFKSAMNFSLKVVGSALILLAVFGLFLGIAILFNLSVQKTENELRNTRDRLSGAMSADQRVQATDWGSPELRKLLTQIRTNAVCDDKGFALPGALRTVSTFDCIELGDYRIVPDEFAEQAKVYVSKGANISQPMTWDGRYGHLSDHKDWEKVSRLLSEYLNQ